jgi:hypothetical protein
MFGMRMDARTTTPSIDRSAAGIAMRSRRTARGGERAYWIACDARERAEPERSALRLVGSIPGAASVRDLALARRA